MTRLVRSSLRCLALCGVPLLAACSTLFAGTGQRIALSTPGAADATCHLTGGDHVDLTVTPPASVRVPKSKRDIQISCSTADHRAATAVLRSTYSDLSIVEAPLGYGVDAISGAMWTYPRTLAVPITGAAQPG